MKRSIQEDVACAVQVFQALAGESDDRIEEELLAHGAEPELAVRLIQFLPIAFCRVLLRPQGVKFPDTYRVMGPDGADFGTFPIDGEPIYVEATAAALREMDEGRGGAPFLAIAGRSGAFQSVMDLSSKGSRLQDIACSPPILQAKSPPLQNPKGAVVRQGLRWPWSRKS